MGNVGSNPPLPSHSLVTLQYYDVEPLAWLAGLYITAQGAWKVLPDPLKRLTAAALRKLPTLPNAWKRRVVKNELEGNLNAALKEFSREGSGFVGHEITIEWLTPSSDARETFFRSGKAFLKLSFSENNDRNLVEAALKFCSEGLMSSTRQYVPLPLMRAIDLMFVDEMLERRHADMSRTYLIQEVIPREVEQMPESDSFIETLSQISQQGLFTRIFLPELRDYPGYVPARMAHEKHHSDVIAFMEFLEDTVRSREQGGKTVLLHRGVVIRVAIVLVGIPDKLRFQGTRPYVRRAAMNNKDGARIVYLLGYNEGTQFIGPIATEAKRVSKKWGRVLTASASVSSWHCRSTPRWSPAVLHSPCSADGSVPAMQMFSQPPIFAATPRTDGCLSDASQSPAPNPIQT